LEDSIEKRFSLANEVLSKVQSCEYKLIFDRKEGREKLRQALEKAEHRVVMVCPWVTDHALNFNDIKKALDREIRIYIGWGHLNDIDTFRNSNPQLNPTEIDDQFYIGNWRYNAISDLKKLKQDYDDKLFLKLLRTHEKFLICDNSWALITSHNFLSSGEISPEREIGLFTNDQNIIKNLLKRYKS